MSDTSPLWDTDWREPLQKRAAARMEKLEAHRRSVIHHARPLQAAAACPEIIEALVMRAIQSVVQADGSLMAMRSAVNGLGIPSEDAVTLAKAAGVPDQEYRMTFGSCAECVFSKDGRERGWAPPCANCNGYRSMFTTQADLDALKAGKPL